MQLTAPRSEVLLLRSKEELASLQAEMNRIRQRKAWQELAGLEEELTKLQKLQRVDDRGRSEKSEKGGAGSSGSSSSRARDDSRRASERPTKQALEAELAKYQVRRHA